MPERPPTSCPSSQHSILCAFPLWKSDRHACSIGLLIQLSGRSGAASAQARRMAGNAWSAVTRNLSERIVLRSDRDKCSPLNGRIARLLEIGRESCRERVCQYVLISGVDVSLKKQIVKIYSTTS